MSPEKRVTRVVYAVFIAITAAFVVTNVVEVSRALFAPGGGAAGGPRVAPACAAGVRELAGAVDRARLVASSMPRGEDAEKRYEDAKGATFARYDELTRPCTTDPNGTDALAALARFDRATASAVRRQTFELETVRHEVDSFIR